jgi:hypothetical protein
LPQAGLVGQGKLLIAQMAIMVPMAATLLLVHIYPLLAEAVVVVV